MAKLSEETIEKIVVSKEKPNLKISRKTKNNQVTENSTTDTDNISKSEPVTSKKNSTKRTIKDITQKSTEKKQIKNSVKNEKKEEKNQTSIKAPTPKKAKTTKRTLHLNIEKTCSEKEEISSSSFSHAVDTSVNQNSPFFYEPSVFEKFNICITSIDDNDSNINSDTETELSNNSETEQNEITDIKLNENSEAEQNEITDIKLNENYEAEQNEITDIELNENSEAEQNEITDIELNENLETDTLELDDLIELIELDNSDNIIELDSTEDIANNLSEDNIVLESADSTIEEINQTLKEVSSNPIGKFFNSSIPSLNSNDSSNTKFEKLKKSIFTNISPIFKRFTFEEANIVMNSDNTTDIQENLINDTNSYLDSIPENIMEQNLVGNSDFENEFEFSAKNTTIDIPKTKNDSILENQSTAFDIDYSKIITPDSNKSDTISIDNEIIDELINNSDFIDNDIEDELVNDSDFINDDIDDDIDDEIVIDELDVDNIEEIDLEETEYNDDNFSIESYFGLDKLTDEDFAEIDFNKSSTTKEEPIDTPIDIDEEPGSTISPEEFVEKFLDANETSDTSDNTDIENELNTELLEDLDNLDTLDNLNDLAILDSDTSNESSNETNDNSVITITEENTDLNPENITEENNTATNNTPTEDLPKDVNSMINGSEFTKLLESFNKTISTLSDRIANLEAEKLKIINDFEKTQKQPIVENDANPENIELDTHLDLEELSESEKNEENTNNQDFSEDIISEDLEINLNDLDIEDLDLSDVDIDTLDLENEIDNLDIEITTDDEPSLYETNDDDSEKMIEDLFENNIELDEEIENTLLSEVLEENNLLETPEIDLIPEIDIDTITKLEELDDTVLEDFLLENIYEEDLKKLEVKTENVQTINHFAEMSDEYKDEPLSDFLTLIDSISKTIEDLENSPDIQNVKKEKKNDLPTELSDVNGKSINILINKDDIFSISILNETYEIVADFDGISVISENIHISTPKNNFFVKVGDKYIEIHNKKDNFIVLTNFEDVEFANAINNVAFAKKHNKIELNIKEAFKLSSINNKIELSMLNTSIANMTNTSSPQIDESSICDNRTLLISEETQKVYLPYTIEEVMKKLASSNEYQTPKEVIENEYTLPLSTFKMPVISRFKEAYRFMRIKEKSSIYAAVDLGLELMFNSNLNPAVIRAAKDLKELNIYLDCLYENEVDKFDCFKIVYKVLPKIQ